MQPFESVRQYLTSQGIPGSSVKLFYKICGIIEVGQRMGCFISILSAPGITRSQLRRCPGMSYVRSMKYADLAGISTCFRKLVIIAVSLCQTCCSSIENDCRQFSVTFGDDFSNRATHYRLRVHWGLVGFEIVVLRWTAE